MIAVAQVMVALQPWLGLRLSKALEPLMGEIAQQLNSFSARQDLLALSEGLDSQLFQAVRQCSRGTLLAQGPDGSFVRMRMEDFSMMADDLMLLLFDQFPVDSSHLLLLRDYSMHASSLAALRTLYTRFAPLETRQELDMIASVARACHPAFRLRGWLEP